MDAQGLHVVFTGPAVNPDGGPVLREDLKAACIAKGMVVQTAVTKRTNLLVCSRIDTTKAARAKEYGIAATGYVSFILTYFDENGIAPAGGVANPIVDTNLPLPGIAYGDEL